MNYIGNPDEAASSYSFLHCPYPGPIMHFLAYSQPRSYGVLCLVLHPVFVQKWELAIQANLLSLLAVFSLFNELYVTSLLSERFGSY